MEYYYTITIDEDRLVSGLTFPGQLYLVGDRILLAAMA